MSRLREENVVVQKEATVVVNELVSGAVSMMSQRIVRVPVKDLNIPDAHSVVTVSADVTKNLGNYCSYKCGMSISMPVVPDPKVIDVTVKDLRNYIDKELAQIVENAKAQDAVVDKKKDDFFL